MNVVGHKRGINMKILVIYYSLFGNTLKMARAVVKGAESITDAQVSLMRVPELMPQEIIDKNERMKRIQSLQKDIPIAKVEDLSKFDAFIFGSPTRYGNMCSQMKNFLDQTGSLWQKGVFIGKPAAIFTCSATLHGGQESTLLSMMIPLLHFGMIIVGVPYSVPELTTTKSGGTPYGATAVVGPDADQPPTEIDLKIAEALGQRVAEITKKLTYKCRRTVSR